MGFYQAGYTSYPNYLRSDWFRRVKAEAYRRAGGACAICGQRWDLQPHHLTYHALGKWWEHYAIRYLCSRHHKECTYVLWFIKVPLYANCMIPRYIFVKWRHIAIRRTIIFCRWMYYSYRISGETNKIKRAVHEGI